MAKDNSLNNRIKIATKWSAITEILAKLISPLTSMVLARLLTPEAFGIVATLTMVITFAEIFTDAGFQKYIIQHKFKNEIDKEDSTNVAFWSNFVMSMIIWGGIALFRDPLAELVGNPGLGYVLVIACVSIPLCAFSSIQMARYKRDLDFRTLFRVRVVGVLVPLFVTIPLAFYMRNFWALVIGTITANCINAILLTYYSKWKPKFFFSKIKFKEMFSFSMWSMFEQVTIWLTSYVDAFIVGTMLSQYYLGIYRTSVSVVGQIVALITAVTTPVLFSSLSKLQDDREEFLRLFFKFQKFVGLLVMPLGVGIFIFRKLITDFFLGDQWGEAAYFIGLWGLTSSITIVLSHYSSEVYRAKGKPKLSVLAQVLHIVVLCPAVLIAIDYGFYILCTVRAIVRLELIAVNLIIMYLLMKMPIGKMFSNILPSCIASCAMMIVLFLPEPSGLFQNIFYVMLDVILYVAVIMFFPQEKSILLNIKTIIKK